MISAHYGMSDVFDNLVISLCKFTTLLSSAEVCVKVTEVIHIDYTCKCTVAMRIVLFINNHSWKKNYSQSPESIPVMFGSNSKAQLAARTVFGLAHRHGDILREGWKNILDCMLQLYRAKLLPKGLIEVRLTWQNWTMHSMNWCSRNVD